MPAEYVLYIIWLKHYLWFYLSAFIMNDLGAFCLLVKGCFVLFLVLCKCNISGKSLGQIIEKHMVAGEWGQLCSSFKLQENCWASDESLRTTSKSLSSHPCKLQQITENERILEKPIVTFSLVNFSLGWAAAWSASPFSTCFRFEPRLCSPEIGLSPRRGCAAIPVFE